MNGLCLYTKKYISVVKREWKKKLVSDVTSVMVNIVVLYPTNMYEKYGESHRQAKLEKQAQSGGERVCRVTGASENIHYHHNLPKLFNGANHPSNYLELAQWLHVHLHESANVNDPNMVGKRVSLTRNLMQNLLNPEVANELIAKIRELDSYMLEMYVSNLLNNISHKVREQVIFHTILTGMNSTRDLSIEREMLLKRVEQLENEIARLTSQGTRDDPS